MLEWPPYSIAELIHASWKFLGSDKALNCLTFFGLVLAYIGFEKDQQRRQERDRIEIAHFRVTAYENALAAIDLQMQSIFIRIANVRANFSTSSGKLNENVKAIVDPFSDSLIEFRFASRATQELLNLVTQWSEMMRTLNTACNGIQNYSMSETEEDKKFVSECFAEIRLHETKISSMFQDIQNLMLKETKIIIGND